MLIHSCELVVFFYFFFVSKYLKINRVELSWNHYTLFIINILLQFFVCLYVYVYVNGYYFIDFLFKKKKRIKIFLCYRLINTNIYIMLFFFVSSIYSVYKYKTTHQQNKPSQTNERTNKRIFILFYK